MEKPALMVILGLGIILLFSGCAQTEPSTKFVCADGITIVTDINACPAGATPKVLTQEEKDMEVCSGMPSLQGASFEDVCITGLAGKYKNTALCKEVARDQRTACYTVVAEVKSNPDVCSEAESQADQCLEQYARDKKDSSVCAKMADISNKDRCYSDFANQLSDSALCEKIRTVDTKDSCYFNLAMRLRDSAYCEKITNANQKQNCEQNVQGKSGYQVPIQK